MDVCSARDRQLPTHFAEGKLRENKTSTKPVEFEVSVQYIEYLCRVKLV